MLDHQTIEGPAPLATGRRLFINIEAAFGDRFLLLFVEFIRACRRRPEISVQRLAAPGGLDDQDRPVDGLSHPQAKGVFRPDCVARFRGVCT